MSNSTFKSIISGKQDQFEEKVDVGDALLRKLETYNVITKEHRYEIEVSAPLSNINRNFCSFRSSQMNLSLKLVFVSSAGLHSSVSAHLNPLDPVVGRALTKATSN